MRYDKDHLKNRRIDFRFTEVEMETLDFFKAAGIPYAQTVRKALDEYYLRHHRNTKLGDLGKQGEVDPLETRSVPDEQL